MNLPPGTRETRVWLVSGIVLAGLLGALAFHYAQRVYRHKSFPHTTFLYNPTAAGSDFSKLAEPTSRWDPYESELSVYPPLTYVPLYPFALMPGRTGLFLFSCLFVVGVLWFVSYQLRFLPRWPRLCAALMIGLCNYAVLFCLDRGNVEAFVFLALGGFFLCYRADENSKVSRLSMLFLASAIAMKIYPAVYLVLLFARRQYRAIAETLLIALTLTLLAAALLPDGVSDSLVALKVHLENFRAEYVTDIKGLQYNSSYWGLLKFLILPRGDYREPLQNALLLPYIIASLALFAALSIYIWRVERTYWKQVTILTCTMLLLPHVSFDYRLIHLLLPVGLFLASNTPDRFGSLYGALWGALLIPKAYVFLVGFVSIGCVINPLIMTVLLGLIVADGLRVHATPVRQDPGDTPTLEPRKPRKIGMPDRKGKPWRPSR